MHTKPSLKALRACFTSTLPVLTGYIFLGIAYGILMRVAGYPLWLPILSAIIIYTGSLEFLLVEILASPFHPLNTLVTAIMVGARHIFYGIAMLEKYGKMGWKKYYLIYTTSDETFAINYAASIEDGIDRGWYYFWVSFLDQLYWVIGVCIGVVCGGFIKMDISGLDFVMTSMFTVILASQWMKDGTRFKTVIADHYSALIGFFGSLGCLWLFGKDRFIIPSMIVILVLLVVFRKPIEASLERKRP